MTVSMSSKEEEETIMPTVEYIDGCLRMNSVSPNHKKRTAEQSSRNISMNGKDNLKTNALLVQKKKGSSPISNLQKHVQLIQKVQEIPMSKKRRALFEPLDFTKSLPIRSAESVLPPPDFDSADYPHGWAEGKRRKLVNVDVVESMRRVAILEMNRKDREIDGLNEKLEEDAQCLEHLQQQLLQERSKRAEIERENAALQSQMSILMDMLRENDESIDDAEPVADEIS